MEKIFEFNNQVDNETVIEVKSGDYFKGIIIISSRAVGDVNFVVNLCQGSQAEIYALVVGEKNEQTGFQIIMNHLEPETRGTVAVKAVLGAKSRFNFDGLIKIYKAAQKTQSYLREDVLLLSKTARTVGQPRLEIAANDVKASHGSTVGRIDENQLFYLASRGVSREASRQIIVDGFISTIVEQISNVTDKTRIKKNINHCHLEPWSVVISTDTSN